MSKTLNKTIVFTILISLIFPSFVHAAKKKEDIKLPVQLKEKRLELLNKIANEKIRDEEYPYSSTNEVLEVIEKINIEDRIINGQISKENIKKRYRTIQVSTNPSDEFPTINLAPNFSTTLMFLDKLGNPWSIEKFIVGSAENYHPEIQEKNIITFTPKSKADNSNLTAILKNGDVSTAISFNLKINTEIVDFISEITIDGYGDNSPKETEVTYISTNSEKNSSNKLLYLSKNEKTFMSEMIANTLPHDFTELKVYSKDGEVQEGYRIFHKKEEKFLYVRTMHDIFSPNIIKQRNGIDKNVKVMKIPYTTSLVVKEFGKLVHVDIKN
jgi:hypothetical protein